MTRKFTRRFDPNGPRDPEYELSDYDHRKRSPVDDPYIFDFEPNWTVDPHTTDLNAQPFDPSNAAPAPLPEAVFSVPGGVPHDVFHISASCPALSADLALAQQTISSAETTSSSLESARQDGLACVVCLPYAAPLTDPTARPKACLVASGNIESPARLLLWRRNQTGDWVGLVVHNANGACEAIPSSRLRQVGSTRGPADPAKQASSNTAASRRRRPAGAPDPDDLNSARRYLELGARAGNTDAMRDLGVLLAYRTDPPELGRARSLWEESARDGDRDAMFQLARFYAILSDTPDPANARYWYERAGANGDVGAMRHLGHLLLYDLETPAVDEAIKWWERAASNGDPIAQMDLGVLYGFQLVEPDVERARHWLTRAAEAGYLNAMGNLGLLLAYHLDPADPQSGCRWLSLVASAGVSRAMLELGLLLAYQLEPPDVDKAEEWLELAYQAGETEAVTHLERLRADRSS